MACVYRHIRLDKNEPFYIGVGRTTARSTHIFGRNQDWVNITESVKWRVDILLDDISPEDAITKEREFILMYGRKDLGTGPLVNRNAGGQSGTHGKRNLSPEQLEKLRKHAIEVFSRPNVRAKIAAAQKGMKKSKEHGEKIAATRKKNGWVVTEETRKKISDFRKTVKRSVIDRLKQSVTTFNNTPQYVFKKPPLETFKSTYTLIQSDPITGVEIARYDFIRRCAYDMGFNPNGITKAIRSKGFYAGFLWRKEPLNAD